VRHVIAGYTREAGVRNLDRELEKICRKVAREIVDNPGNAPRRIGLETVREFLGPVRFRDNPAEKRPEVGTCLGLAWTETGGEMLPVEVSLMPGKGNLVLTGKLGEVMQESAKTALSYIRAHADELGIAPDFNERQDIHIHLPEGAIAKDGPSAGITMATALASALSRRPVRQDTAMTGEITLRGRVLKIGGLKEKVLAAHRVKIRTIILPRENLDDLGELADNVRRQMRFIPVENLWEVLAHMLKPAPRPAAGRRTRGGSRQARAGG
jgi:ATP-dependent Lon protease